MQLIGNFHTRIKAALPFIIFWLALMYCFKPSHGFAFDQRWDGGHITTDMESPDPHSPPDDDTGGDGDDDDGEYRDADQDKDDADKEDSKEEDQDEDEEDDDDDCKEDCNNECKPDAKKSPVYVKSGNLELKYIDLEIGGIGPALNVTRTFNSQDRYNGPFGNGWTFNLAARLIQVSDNSGDYIIIRKPSGKRLKFIKTDAGLYTPVAASVTDQLIATGDGFTLNCKTCSKNFLKPTYHFTPQGNLTWISDNDNNRIDFAYDPQNRLFYANNSATGRSLSISYGENGKISRIRINQDRIWTYEYDERENLTKVTDPLGYALVYEYDNKNKLLSVTDKNGNQNPVITYDESLRVKTFGRGKEIYSYTYFTDEGYTQKVDPLGNIFKFFYDQNGNVIKTILPDGSEVITQISQDVKPVKRIDAKGNEWRYTYNKNGQILTETDPLGNTTAYTYDAEFNKIKTKTDALGATWEYTYNTRGNLAKFTDPLGCETTLTYDDQGRMISKTNGLNQTFSYVYDAAGNQIKVTRPDGSTTAATYDALGNMLTQTDARGNTWTYTYDLLNRVTQITDPLGKTKTFTYDGNGNQTSITNENGVTTTFAYDNGNRQISKTDSLGNKTLYTYDAAGHMLSTTDPLGNTTSKVYDNRYLITSSTDAAGNTTAFTYDKSGNRLTKTDARGNTWIFTYDAMDRLLSETNPLGNVTSYAYDAVGNKVKMTDPLGNPTYYDYNLAGHLVRTVIKVGDTAQEPDDDDVVTRLEYDCTGRRIAETDALGQKTTWTFNYAGKVLTETNSLGEIKAYTYDPNGNKLTYTTITGNVIKYTYDKLNRLASAGDTAGVFETYEYDGVGNKTKTTTADGNSTTTVYTAFNKPSSVTDPDGNSSIYTYDANYNLISVVDRLGKTTVNGYDKLNRLQKVTDPLGNVSLLTFDAVGNMVKMTDANLKETVYAYDAANRLKAVTYADGTSKGVTYNAAGKIISKTDQNGTVINYERDALHRIIKRQYPDTSSYTYSYDRLGRLKTATNSYGTISFSFDASGRITAIDQNGTSISYTHNVSNRTRTIHYPSGRQVKETYTLRDKIDKIEDIKIVEDAPVATMLVNYQYDSLSRPVTKAFGNGVSTAYTYGKTSRITSISYTDAGNNDLLGYHYAYDAEGNRLRTIDSVFSNASQTYAYDDSTRLTQFKQGDMDESDLIPTPQFNASYELDPVGNMLKVTTNGTEESRAVNGMNQYTTVGGSSLSYDANGNLIDDGVQTYQYDYENQLIKVTRKSDSSVVAAFTIDALNRRVQKQVNGITTEYIYDDSRIIEEHESSATTACYVYGNQLDEAILMARGDSTSYYLTDVLGSVMALTDNSGTLTERYQYDAYGQVRVFDAAGQAITVSAQNNPYRFTGRRYDEKAGIYYYRARCYHPGLGRFLNPDPKGFIDGMNLYEYAMSNPLRYTDPRGTSVKTCDSHSISFDADRIKKLIPKFLSKYMDSGSIGISYQKCKECCGEKTKNAGKYVINKELSVTVGWSGDTGYINTPWGISWDIDVWLYQSKGFIGLVAKVSWGLSGSLSGGFDNCDEQGFGKGCVNGSLSLEALFGLAEEDEDSSLVKAYVSGGVNGSIQVCLKVQGGILALEAGAGVSGTIKGTAGIWKFTYERTFYEINGSVGPYVVFKI